MSSNSAVIEFSGVSYQPKPGQPVLEKVNLRIEGGELFVLLGQSGAGKTTALRLINRLLDPSSGEIRVEGKRTVDWDVIQLRRRIGYSMQDVGLFPHFTVARNVGVVPKLEGWDEARTQARVNTLLELLGLAPAEFSGRYPHQLSGGQRQRVGLARALAADPPILLLDEPFGALDPLVRARLQREFAMLQRKLRKTVVFVTHDVREALVLADHIALLDAALVRNVFTRDEFTNTSDELAREFLVAAHLAIE